MSGSGIGPISRYDFWKLNNPYEEEEDDGNGNEEDGNDDGRNAEDREVDSNDDD